MWFQSWRTYLPNLTFLDFFLRRCLVVFKFCCILFAASIWQHVFRVINFEFYCSIFSFRFCLSFHPSAFRYDVKLSFFSPAWCHNMISSPTRMEIYSTLVSEILKYYYDVEDINGYDYDGYESARCIFATVFVFTNVECVQLEFMQLKVIPFGKKARLH